jgi:hypothetical protein
MKGLKGVKKMRTFKKLFMALLVTMMFSVTVLGYKASAEVKPYFNYYHAVDGVGDEADFLRIGKTAAEGKNTLEACEEGTAVDFWFYIHNGSEPEFNGTNFDGDGVAHNTRLNLSVPQNQKSHSHQIAASISADRADTVHDTATITCGSKNITLEYKGVTDFSTTASTNVLGEYKLGGDPINGASLGYPGGVVPGCWDFRGRLNFRVIVHVEQDKTTPPVSKPKPKALPNTGSGDVVAIFLATTAVTTLAYAFVGRKQNV